MRPLRHNHWRRGARRGVNTGSPSSVVHGREGDGVTHACTLHYRDLKTIARASLAHSFLQPDVKAAAQKAQETDFTAFEDLFGNA